MLIKNIWINIYASLCSFVKPGEGGFDSNVISQQFDFCIQIDTIILLLLFISSKSIMWPEWLSDAQIKAMNVTRKFDHWMLMREIAYNTSGALSENIENTGTIIGRIVDDRENKKTIFIPANENID